MHEPCPVCGQPWAPEDFKLSDGKLFYRGRFTQITHGQAKFIDYLWYKHKLKGCASREELIKITGVSWASIVVYASNTNRWLRDKSIPYKIHTVPLVGYSLRKLPCSNAYSSEKPGEPTRPSPEPDLLEPQAS